MNNNIEKNELYNEIKKIIEDSRSQIIRSINSVIVISYWNIGKAIVEKQNRTEKTTYGEKLLEQVSIQIEREYGRGFSKRYLELMRQFYLTFQNAKSLLSQLSWTHYLELIKIKNKEEREWYLNESIKGNLSSRQLHRLITTFTYNRVLNNKPLEVSSDKLTTYNNQRPEETIKNPYILDFLGLSDKYSFHEKDLEGAILTHLQEFLLELGRGFAFYARQYKLTGEDGDNYYCDLVFYNTLLKCYIVIDLKVGKLEHQDIGQIDMYRRFFDDKVKNEDDNQTIGLLLVEESNSTVIKYSIMNETDKLFVSKYYTIMPTKEELIKIIQNEKNRLINNK